MIRVLLLASCASAFVLKPVTPMTANVPNKYAACSRHLAVTANAKHVSLLRNAASLAVCAAVVLGSPSAALAKGGGVHSSSRSSSHSSHVSMSRSYSPSRSTSSPSRSSSSRSRSSSSSRSRSSSSAGSTRRSTTTYRSPPPPPPPTEVHEYHTYRPSRTVYRSRPTVVYDSPTVVYDSPSPVVVTPRSATDQAFHNGLWSGRLEGAVLASGAALLAYDAFRGTEGRAQSEDDEADYDAELLATRQLMRELEHEFDQTDAVVSAIQRPASGKYVGESAEDDGGDQGVFTHLRFNADGDITGWGDDAEDGKYVIKAGRWHSDPERTGGARVAWIEQYEDGFEVALRGQIRDDGTILGMWASSRGVAGSVELVA